MRLLRLVTAAALCSCVGAFIVPDQLVSLLTVVYSVIPPIRKGTDSRVGFGYRFGPFADLQVLLELGPQSETRPIGGQAGQGAASAKRHADEDPAKRPSVQVLDEPQGEQAASSRSARSRPAPTAGPPPSAASAASSDWLSRWRSSLGAASEVAVPQARLYNVAGHPQDSRRRAARAPAASNTASGYRAAPTATRTSSASARWEAMQRLRSLHWASQQG